MCSKLVMQILQNHHSEAVFSWDTDWCDRSAKRIRSKNSRFISGVGIKVKVNEEVEPKAGKERKKGKGGK